MNADIEAMGPPPLGGRHYFLRALEMDDYPVLRALELGAESIHLYRHRSLTPSPDAWAGGLWHGVDVHFAVCVRVTGEPVGSAVCYNADYRDRKAFISVFMAKEHRGPASFEAFQLFIDYLFAALPLRQLSADILAPNLEQMVSFPDYLFVQEAHFVEDSWVLGRYVDRYIFTLRRERWIELMSGDEPHRMGSLLARDLMRPVSESEEVGTP